MDDSLVTQHAPKPFRFSLKQLMIVISIFAGVLGLGRAAYVTLTHFEAAENVDRVDWLPDSAANISYYKSYSFTAYEFDMPEQDFIAWSSWELEPITTPVDIFRYQLPLTHRRTLPAHPTQADLNAWMDLQRHRASKGLFYRRRRSNGGGVTVVYDRDLERGYFQTNPR